MAFASHKMAWASYGIRQRVVPAAAAEVQMTLTEMWVIATGVLLVGLVDDLRSRKVHNELLMFLLPVAVVCSFYFRGFDGSALGLGALVAALVLTIPLFIGGVLGGGDVKLFAVFAFCVDPVSMLWTLIYSFIWGAVFGLARATLQRQLLTLVRNTYKMAKQHREPAPVIHKFPYTFSLLLGWFTQLTLLHAGGLI
jgi:Flp pilus assembly protein protease CpaA